MKSLRALSILFFGLSLSSWGAEFPVVQKYLEQFDFESLEKRQRFASDSKNIDPDSHEWARRKLRFMVELDQHARFYLIKTTKALTKPEQKVFETEFSIRLRLVDSENIADLKVLLAVYSWFDVGVFGQQADRDAWLLVQHADQEPALQRHVLKLLESRYPQGQTAKDHYAYLYDRVATSPGDETKRRLQRFGTQGRCVGSGTWEAYPSEEPAELDSRRASFGLPPMAEYQKSVRELCQ